MQLRIDRLGLDKRPGTGLYSKNAVSMVGRREDDKGEKRVPRRPSGFLFRSCGISASDYVSISERMAVFYTEAGMMVV